MLLSRLKPLSTLFTDAGVSVKALVSVLSALARFVVLMFVTILVSLVKSV